MWLAFLFLFFPYLCLPKAAGQPVADDSTESEEESPGSIGHPTS